MKVLSIILLLFCLVTNVQAQSTTPETITVAEKEEAERRASKIALLSDIQTLDAEAAKLDDVIARAAAKCEIADAAWTIDREWAKELLRAAYDLTFPDEEEQKQLRERPAGTAPKLPTDEEQQRAKVRSRVLAVAARDKTLADELARSGGERLGKLEEHARYADLAARAMKTGDTGDAGNYITQSLAADPTQIAAGLLILDVAAADRAAADKLIIQYIEQLRRTPISMANQSAHRVHFALRQIVFPSANLNPKSAPPTGISAVRAYLGYVIESIGALEQREPGAARMLRPFLLSAWQPLNQYAPDLVPLFMRVKGLSRRPDEDAQLPSAERREANKNQYDERVKRSLESGKADSLTINFAISRGDFDDARKMIDMLPDGEEKNRLTEMVNSQEALSLIEKGDAVAAERLAMRLVRALNATSFSGTYQQSRQEERH
ncbi:MAG: hypothetical protein MSG64_00230 [Pyrinomonadaceae bacterium MAG19_C2-C3]|nr:hypothetical protein [Pyrinomonadaceae bacterium MAG19_C2-C3]